MLTADQQREMARIFVCPATLPDDASRIAAINRFIKRYAELAPASRPAEQLAFYETLQQRNKCAPTDGHLNHTIPEL